MGSWSDVARGLLEPQKVRHLAQRRSIGEILNDVEAQHGGRVGFATAAPDLNDERSTR